MDTPRDEVHISIGPVGHQDAADCWCEPNRIYWFTNQHGITMLVIEHNDETPAHHTTVIAARDQDLSALDDGSPDSPWVTRALNILGQPEIHVVHVPRKEKPR